MTGALQPAYWQALIVVSLLYFARFDPSFITLRAKLVRGHGVQSPACMQSSALACAACLRCQLGGVYAATAACAVCLTISADKALVSSIQSLMSECFH